MRKPEKIRAIYSELRRLLGSEASAGDLIKLAHMIVNTYYSNTDELLAFGRISDSRALLYLALDEAFVDGGWRVLDFEKSLFSIVDDEDLNATLNRIRISGFTGLGWEYV